MKKFVSFALMLALVFTCAVSTVSADTAETTVFEPSYDSSNWTVTLENDATNSISAEEKQIYFHGGTAKAVYKPGVMKGDFVLTAQIGAVGGSDGNRMIINVAGVAFKFYGSGKVGINDTKSENSYKQSDGFYFTIVYKDEGEIKLYCANASGENELVETLSGSEYANKNDGSFSIEEAWVQWTAIKNIKMYKPLTETYLNTFDGENPLSDIENVGGSFVILKPNFQDNNVLTTDKDGNHHAWINKYTAGSFSMSFDWPSSATSNNRYFIFNAISSNDVYAFAIEGNKTIKLAKGNVSDCNFTSTNDLATATVTDSNVVDILGKLVDFGEIRKIRIDYNAEQGGIYVYLNGKSQPVLSVMGDVHKDKVGRFGIILRWQKAQTFIDNLQIEPSLPGFNVSVPTVTINTETNTVTGSAKVTNTTGSAKDAVVILAIYDKDKNLVEVKTAALANTMTACRDFELKAECTSWGDGKTTAKCFVFDSLDTVAPLTNAVSYPEN